jgi:caspase-like apoptosis-related cysteine protease
LARTLDSIKETKKHLKEKIFHSSASCSGSNTSLAQPSPTIFYTEVETDDGMTLPAMLPSLKTSISMMEEKTKKCPSVPVTEETHYYMGFEKRGKALIFNHKQFDQKRENRLKSRSGTEKDADILNETLTSLGFDVSIDTDPVLDTICEKLDRAVAAEDNEDSDCVLVAVLSHGHDDGKISAYDQDYREEILWKPFLGKKARRLNGKPKLFIIQACRGTGWDEGVEIDGAEQSKGNTGVTRPSHADFLIARATVPGHVSFRNKNTGSYFIQELCAVLKSEAYTEDLVSILTKVQGNMARKTIHEQYKQIPSFTSQLSKKMQFVKKMDNN